MKKFSPITILSLLFIRIYAAPVIAIALNDENNGNATFNIILPSNELIQVTLSIKLMKHVNLPDELLDIITSSIEPTTTTASNEQTLQSDKNYVTVEEAIAEESDKNYVTVKEAIEGFRHDLIKKEKEIAGFIESENIFYRHFQLEHSDEEKIKIRCSYDSNFKKRTLKINCLEYMEIETQRILSNGEMERFTNYDTSYRSDLVIIDVNKLKQTYHMEIS